LDRLTGILLTEETLRVLSPIFICPSWWVRPLLTCRLIKAPISVYSFIFLELALKICNLSTIYYIFFSFMNFNVNNCYKSTTAQKASKYIGFSLCQCDKNVCISFKMSGEKCLKFDKRFWKLTWCGWHSLSLLDTQPLTLRFKIDDHLRFLATHPMFYTTYLKPFIDECRCDTSQIWNQENMFYANLSIKKNKNTYIQKFEIE